MINGETHMIADTFLDIIKHTAGLGFIELVKVEGSDKNIQIAAMDEDRTVVINGVLNTPIEGLDGTVGLSRIGILSGYLKFPAFLSDKAKVEIVTQERKQETIPAEISFDSTDGHNSHYRFMSPEIVEETIRVPPFKGSDFAVEVTPTKSALQDLGYMTAILGGVESLFTASTNAKNELIFSIGSGPTDRTKIVFAKDIKGELNHQWSYPLSQVLAICKLHDTSKSMALSFSDQGALKIVVESGIGEYTYILPARSQ